MLNKIHSLRERQEAVRGWRICGGEERKAEEKKRKKKTSVEESRLEILTKPSLLCERWCVTGMANESGVAQEA